MFLIPTDRNLTGAEIELVPMPERERRLKRVVDALRPSFDYVFIDCPPSLGLVDAQRAGRGRRGVDPAALRVLRARRPG
jgi:cellulose biosynthesis protein BcsQ